jgi:hypothetical protein
MGCHRNARRAIVVVLAAAWFTLGFVSDNVPWGSDVFWLIACGIAAGSALALAQHTTMYALHRYVFATSTIGIIRSTAYASNGAYGPMFVWVILTLTTVVAACSISALNGGRRHGARGAGQ